MDIQVPFCGAPRMHILSLLVVLVGQLAGDVAVQGDGFPAGEATVLLRQAPSLPDGPSPWSEDSDPGYVEEVREEVEVEEDLGTEGEAISPLALKLTSAYWSMIVPGIVPGAENYGFTRRPLSPREAHRILRC